MKRILNVHRGESIMCTFMILICVYCWAFEPYALNSSLVKRIDKIASVTQDEKGMFFAFQYLTNAHIKAKYGVDIKTKY